MSNSLTNADELRLDITPHSHSQLCDWLSNLLLTGSAKPDTLISQYLRNKTPDAAIPPKIDTRFPKPNTSVPDNCARFNR